MQELVSSEHFQTTDVEHRFRTPEPHNAKVDIVPFGLIEDAHRTIRWQRTAREMNMAGFSEAYPHTIDAVVSSEPRAVVKIASLPGLCVLKLLSWNDNPTDRDRDARDFRLVMYKYLDTQDYNRVIEIHEDIAGIGDYELISARLLGRDMGVLAGPGISTVLINILERECRQDGALLFVQHMQKRSAYDESPISRDISMLDTVRLGVLDTRL